MRRVASILMLVFTITLYLGCSGEPDTAMTVADKFWQALQDKDLDKARSYCTEETAESLTLNEDGSDQDVEIVFGDIEYKDEHTEIETMLQPSGDSDESSITLTTILVREDGKWKVDVSRTMMSMFGGAVEEMVEGMSEAMEEAMEKMAEEMQKSMEQMEGSMSEQ